MEKNYISKILGYGALLTAAFMPSVEARAENQMPPAIPLVGGQAPVKDQNGLIGIIKDYLSVTLDKPEDAKAYLDSSNRPIIN